MADRLVFTYDGVKYHIGDLTIAEVEQIENIINLVYTVHDPARNMTHKRAYMAAFLGRTKTDEEVLEIIAKTTLSDVEKMWAKEPDDQASISNG